MHARRSPRLWNERGMGFRPHRNLTRSRTGVPVGSRVPRDRKRKGTPIGMKKLIVCALVAFLTGGVAMGKGTSPKKNAKGAKTGGAQFTVPDGSSVHLAPQPPQTGNISKVRRERLLSRIAAIKTFLERSAGTDTNAVRLLSFAAELEKEVRDKKYGLVFEEHRERVDVELDENIPVLQEVKGRFLAVKNAKNGGTAYVAAEAPLNFLIEGDNLAALKLLEKTHRGRIDLIYIDPPYNTGNEDFIYNDSFVDKTDTFRHSKWLSFMEKRLKVALNLLSSRGVIFISLNDIEQPNCRVLCDAIFGESNFCGQIIWHKKSGGGQTDEFFVTEHEYVLVYRKSPAFKWIDDTIEADAGFNKEDVLTGLRIFLVGFFYKCAVADVVGIFVNNVFNDVMNSTTLSIFLAGFLFSVQMYCDFAGYSEIATGCARMMGIKLSRNFNRPYMSKSYSDFFRRWHMTLTSWFTTYVYIPLGGNRKGKVRHIINIFIVIIFEYFNIISICAYCWFF